MIKPKAPHALCEQCPLKDQPCVPTEGPQRAKVAFVARSPGYHEARTGKVFSGPSGKVLEFLLKQNGVDRNDVLLTNVVLCHAQEVPLEAIAACAPRLRADLSNADTIIAGGSEAAHEIAGVSHISGNRGYVHSYQDSDSRSEPVRVIVTNNPAIVLRDATSFPDLVKDFKLALNPTPRVRKEDLPRVQITNTIREAERWLRNIIESNYATLSVDIETTGLRKQARLVSIGLAGSGDKAVVFGATPCADSSFVRSILRTALSQRNVSYIYHNGKFDVRNLRYRGIPARVDQDTLLLSYALDERSDEAVHNLEYLVKDILGWPRYEPSEVVSWKNKLRTLEKAGRYEEADALATPDALYEYNGLDAAGTAQLYPILKERAIADEVYERPYLETLIPTTESFIRAELNGMYYDVSAAADLLEFEVLPKLDEMREQLRFLVGDAKYNPNSSTQNSKLVYDDWKTAYDSNIAGRPGKQRSVDESVYVELKTGRFTFREALTEPVLTERRQRVQDWAEILFDYKKLEKQRSTYLQGMIPIAEKLDGWINTSIIVHGAVTGRVSSRNPNLQNITRTKPGLPNIRKLFTAPPDTLVLQADYSQAELRCIAYLSQDPELMRIYKEGLDLHNIAAARFYGEDFTKEQRSNTKNMQFGVAYEQSAKTFQEKHNIPEREATEFIKWWWQTFRGVRNWKSEVNQQILRTGVVTSPFGYKRRFYLITNENKAETLREGFNFIPQNTASTLTLHAFNRLFTELDAERCKLVLTVHDEILAYVIENYVHEAGRIIQEVMAAIPKDTLGWELPFVAEVSVGRSWGELEVLSLSTA